MSDLENEIENRLGYGPDGEFVSILPQNDSYSFKNYLTGKYRFEHLQRNTLEIITVSMNAWLLIPLLRRMGCWR